MGDNDEPAPTPPAPKRRAPDVRGRALYAELLARIRELPDRPAQTPFREEPHESAADHESIERAAEALAQALADAFLCGPWTADALRERGTHVLGARRAWLRPLIGTVLAAYRDAPSDRPRELGGFIAASPTYRAMLRSARDHGRRPPRVAARLVAPTRTVRPRWSVPQLDDVSAVADFLAITPDDLDWFADRRGLLRRAADERLRHYRYRWLATRSGGVRLLEMPKFRLKGLQRRLLTELVGLIPPHEAAHGFRPGRSVQSFATPHAQRDLVIRLDLENFFGAVSASRVYGVFRTAGYPEPVAHTLTALVTTATPARVLAQAGRPHGGDADRLDRRRRLLRRLATPHLPQGGPTSPALANLCAYRLDRRLSGLAAAFDASYTRYADDLAFSGSRYLPAERFVELASNIAREEGFRVHTGKTSVRGRGDRQLLGGLVVNTRPAVPRDTYDELRAILHNAARTGPQAQNREGHPDFPAHLLGRIAWVAQSHPARGTRLLEMFGRIAW
jgi:hypothetical protein